MIWCFERRRNVDEGESGVMRALHSSGPLRNYGFEAMPNTF